MGASITGIILAAGQSKRMGAQNKLLTLWKGKPLVQHVVDAVAESQLKSPMLVTGHESERLRTLIEGSIQLIENPSFKTGMASSIMLGVKVAMAQNPPPDGVMILLGDMPMITSSHIDQLIVAFAESSQSKIVVATHESKAGNPVLFPTSRFDDLMNVAGDRGARPLINQEGENLLKVEIGEAASRDFDTPDAFE